MLADERYLQLRKEGIRDMHNNDLLLACREDNLLLEEFLINNKDFIFSIIIKYKGNMEDMKVKYNVDEEEILQHAYIGVISALRDFDFDRGIKFTTYVVRPILWEINQLIYNDSRLVPLSRGAIELVKKIKEVEDALGYLPTDEEISQIIQVPVERIGEIVRFTKEIEHYDDIKSHKNKGVDGYEDSVVDKVFVEELLSNSSLSQFEKDVAELIMEGLNFSQIASRLGVYPMTINRATKRIRDKMKNDDIDKRSSKYEDEITLVAEEIVELGEPMPIEEMQDLLFVCGFDIKKYPQRILYYIRQKALQRVS